MVERDHPKITIKRQATLLSVNRTSMYRSAPPYYGYRRMTRALKNQGYPMNRKRVHRLMRLMGLEAVYPRDGQQPYGTIF
ncbi:IS3 family transposase [Paenibacillus sp. URB8-2]|uniref:IS3 family transposase n=1 Tax=Paenibacillus sp. URB8-2 TaxID=2741301 RepID=UPI0015BCA38E